MEKEDSPWSHVIIELVQFIVEYCLPALLVAIIALAVVLVLANIIRWLVAVVAKSNGSSKVFS